MKLLSIFAINVIFPLCLQAQVDDFYFNKRAQVLNFYPGWKSAILNMNGTDVFVTTSEDKNQNVNLVIYKIDPSKGGLVEVYAKKLMLRNGPYQILKRDLNNDGLEDLVLTPNYAGSVSDPNPFTAEVLFRKNASSFDFESRYIGNLSPNTSTDTKVIATIGDFNGDGWQDIALTGTMADHIDIYLNDKKGWFQLPQRVGFNLEEGMAASEGWIESLDLNRDGYDDILYRGNVYPEPASWNNQDIYLFFGSNNGTLHSSVPYRAPTEDTTTSKILDWNQDGIPDIAYVSEDKFVLLLGDGKGGFQKDFSVSLPKGTDPQSFDISDLNGDGNPDIVVAGDSIVQVLLDTSLKPLSVSTRALTTGRTDVFLGFDVNGDLKNDLLLTDQNGIQVWLRDK